MTGTLYAVGVGPGDPELLTLKAVRLIQSGAVVAYPVGDDSGTSLARKIAASHIKADADEYGFRVPMRVAHKSTTSRPSLRRPSIWSAAAS